MDDTLSFHQLDDVKFLRYMAGCKAYATTAGFESVCEAMYLGKPLLMVRRISSRTVTPTMHAVAVPVSSPRSLIWNVCWTSRSISTRTWLSAIGCVAATGVSCAV